MRNLIPCSHFTANYGAKLLNNLPSILTPVLTRIPDSVHKACLLPILHSIFSDAINEGDFDFLQGSWLNININDLGISWLLSFQNDRLIMAPKNSKKADVCFFANGDDLLLIAGRKEDPDTLFFQRRLKIEGNTELGLAVKNVIDALDLDQLPSIAHNVVSHCANIIAKHRVQSID
ncbi:MULTISPECIES: SCP2 sterol-binding domain-containing protein [Thalassotalea]|uniref:Ubiquinone biosynthesis accessory factor UbiT n=1 Tax=Thalassotalea castellviae TaxID=3075612 RepID=A0ABU2ZX18_9GAMM|nr:SCP2 sterol-binding domain-containing protein [Thalassotalea sp. W431]MDT0602163.1 SCP2 sterol-binding domain-containing protein [Thalassotalea sp. W431]